MITLHLFMVLPKKDNHILKIIKKNRFNEDELVFIGDSTSTLKQQKK